MLLHARIDLREGADRAGNGAGRDLGSRTDQAFLGATEFGVSVGELYAEGRGLGMDAVGAADGRRVLVLEGAALERRQKRVDVRDQEIGGAHELHVETGVEHVRGRHALMHEARLRPHDLGQVGEEGNHVMLDVALDRLDARDVELRMLALVPDRLGRGLRNDAELGHGVGRMRFDLEPDAVTGLRIPDRGHFGPSVARDHGRPWQVIAAL